jgi:hypothetical protein
VLFAIRSTTRRCAWCSFAREHGWNEEQSRQNFNWKKKVVVPGYDGSKLLTSARRTCCGDPIPVEASNLPRRTTRWLTLKAFVLEQS